MVGEEWFGLISIDFDFRERIELIPGFVDLLSRGSLSSSKSSIPQL